MKSVTGASATNPADTPRGAERITETIGSHSYPMRVLADQAAPFVLAKQAATQLAHRQELVFACGFVRSAPLANLGLLT
jgi:hypothetical protein